MFCLIFALFFARATCFARFRRGSKAQFEEGEAELQDGFKVQIHHTGIQNIRV